MEAEQQRLQLVEHSFQSGEISVCSALKQTHRSRSASAENANRCRPRGLGFEHVKIVVA